MKKLNYLMMMLMMCFSMSFLASCSDDDDDDPVTDKLASTHWQYIEDYGSDGTIEYNLYFYNNKTAKIEFLSKKVTGELEQVMLNVSYTYQLAGDMVVLNPKETSRATMEGTIDGLFITLKNLSSGETLPYRFQKKK